MLLRIIFWSLPVFWPVFMASLPAETPTPAPAASSPAKNESTPAATIDPAQIQDWKNNAPEILALLQSGLDLTRQNLKYTYGSADPKQGGMDCSGTIWFLLTQAGIKEVPRQANEQYAWVRKEGLFRAVLSTSENSFELDVMKPGDLLFWTGTYDIQRDPPVTHVMLYLGRRLGDRRRIMLGASEGRWYEGKPRYGVSVFEFQLPGFPLPKNRPDNSSRFVGYGRIPDLPPLAPTPTPSPSPTPLPAPEDISGSE